MAQVETKKCIDCGADMDLVDPESTPGPKAFECSECHLSTTDDLWIIIGQDGRENPC